MEIPTPLQKAIGTFERKKERFGHALRKRVGYFDQIRVVGFNGYGTDEKIKLKGRVLSDGKVEAEAGDLELERLVNMFRRYHTDEVPKARVRATLGDEQIEAETDWEGFFEVEFSAAGQLDDQELWHEVDLELLEPKPRVEQPTFHFTGCVQVPREPKFGIISDLDDTVVRTGATDMLRQARIVMLNGPHSRVPFAGVSAFYRALQDQGGRTANPIFYVSSSPWNIYHLFEEFLELHAIPRGTILLKDFGFDADKFFKSGHIGYKRARIQRVLDTYADLPFVLIGDSGQMDPEIYQAVVEENPGRIEAIYVRDVRPRAEGARDVEVNEIAHAIRGHGVDMLLVDDTLQAARHAQRKGLIEAKELDAVQDASQRDRDRPSGEENGLEKFVRSAKKLFS